MVRHAQRQPEQADDGADQPLGLAVGQAEHGPERECCQDGERRVPGLPTRVVRGSAAHPSIASALNNTVRLPRRRRLASYAGQFVTLCTCLGMWWRRFWFSLKGKAGTQVSKGALPYDTRRLITNYQTDPCTTLP